MKNRFNGFGPHLMMVPLAGVKSVGTVQLLIVCTRYPAMNRGANESRQEANRYGLELRVKGAHALTTGIGFVLGEHGSA